MNANNYQKLALTTAGKTDKNSLLLNGAMGIMGEGGEIIDHIKKYLFQGHEIDKEYLAKELGDVCWYIAVASKAIDYDLGKIMEMNIDKLKKRYPKGFEVERSINREE